MALQIIFFEFLKAIKTFPYEEISSTIVQEILINCVKEKCDFQEKTISESYMKQTPSVTQQEKNYYRVDRRIRSALLLRSIVFLILEMKQTSFWSRVTITKAVPPTAEERKNIINNILLCTVWLELWH